LTIRLGIRLKKYWRNDIDRVASVIELVQVLKSTEDVLDALGVIDNKIFRETPKRCIHCECRKFDTLEIIGVYNKPLFYECIACGTLHLKYRKGWVIKRFKKLSGLYTNPDDWIEPESPEEYN